MIVERNVKRIKFDVLTAAEIRALSVVEVFRLPFMEDKKNTSLDPALGATCYSTCTTCFGDDDQCPGHHGHIELEPYALYNPMLLSGCLKLLNSYCCLQCRRYFRYRSVVCDCGLPAMKYSVSNKVNTTIKAFFVKRSSSMGKFASLHSSTVYASDVADMFKNIPREHAAELGIKCAPEALIFKVLPVTPLCTRPSSLYGSDKTTSLYNKITEILTQMRGHSIKRFAAKEMLSVLQLHVNRLYNFQTCPEVGLKGRHERKAGRWRQNIQGKRVNQSARSVIGGDNNLAPGEVGVPESIAYSLRIPERVHRYNVEEMKKVVRDHHVYVERSGTLYDTKHVKEFTLGVNDIVFRPLKNGDIVVMNRQPSLHRNSMMGHKVRVLPYSTLRINLSVTPSYNADFDGDEMNLHVPSSYQAQVEVRDIMCPAARFHSSLGGHFFPVIQDSLLGIYALTADDTLLCENDAKQILYRADVPFHELRPCVLLSRMCSGKQIVSLILQHVAPGVFYHHKGVLIKSGVLLTGQLKKAHLGKSAKSLLKVVANEYSSDAALDLVHKIQLVANEFINIRGFSVGISDCIIDSQKLDQAIEEGKSRNEVCAVLADEIPRSNSFFMMSDAGSKGSLVNAVQISGKLGYQTGACFRGVSEVENSFFKGLNPVEFFSHTISGRVGLINTSCKTASIGYLQRQLVYALGNIRVEYDRTMRFKTDGRVVDFLYGDDGVASESINETSARFVRACVKDGGSPNILKAMAFRTKMGIADSPFATTIDFHRALEKAKSFSGMLVDASECVRGLTGIDKLVGEAVFSGQIPEQGAIDFKWSLCRRRVEVCPSEHVGSVCSQSISEPITQLTLDSFHHSGVKNETDAFSDIMKLLRNTKSKKKTVLFTHNATGRVLDSSHPSVEVGKEVAIPDRIKKIYENAYGKKPPDKATEIFVSGACPRRFMRTLGHVAAIERHEAKMIRAFFWGDGADLKKLNVSDFVLRHQKTWRSRDLHHVARTLGIEAARQTIINSIRHTFIEAGKRVQDRHIKLIASAMTWSGSLKGVSRHGIIKDGSVCERASFETACAIMENACYMAEEDNTRSNQSSITVGKLIDMNLGMRLDYDKLPQVVDDDARTEYAVSEDGKQDAVEMMSVASAESNWSGMYNPDNPDIEKEYDPGDPEMYMMDSPVYAPDSPVYAPQTPEYAPESPVYAPGSPRGDVVQMFWSENN